MNLAPEQCAKLVASVRDGGGCATPDPGLERIPHLLAHRAAILGIAAELGLPSEGVAQAYCAEFCRLCVRAAVDDYLPVLAAKRVRDRLRAA